MNKDLVFSKSTKIYASENTVWNKLLSAQFYHIAWGATLATTWHVGSSVEFSGEWDGVQYVDKGIVLEYIETRFLKFSYWSSFWGTVDAPEEYCHISYTISQINEYSCEYTITQEGFRDQTHYDETVELWANTSNVSKYESEKDELRSITTGVFADLMSAIESTPEKLYNKEIPGKWSPGQIVEHIIIGNSGLKEFLTATPGNADNTYDSNIDGIRNLMLNNEVKYTSPDFLLPPYKNYNKEAHKEILMNVKTEINDCILTLDFHAICGSAEMPPFGFMSYYEWINFSVFHILRHTRQLNTLVAKNY